MSACGRVAAPTNHDVVEVLVMGLSPFWRGSGGACVGAHGEPVGVFDWAGHHLALTNFRATSGNWRGDTCNGWGHVIEQAGKEAHGVTSA